MINKIFNKEIFGLLIFIYLVSSLNSPPSLSISYSFKDIFNFTRGIAPLVILPVLLFIYLKKKFTLSTSSILFLLFITSQIPGYINFEDRNISDLYWLICALSVIFSIEFYSHNLRNIKILHFIFLSFIIFVTLIISYSIVLEEITRIFHNLNYITTLYSSDIMSPGKNFLGQAVPRSSGYNRMLLVIFLLIFSIILSENKNYKNIIFKSIFYIVLIYIGLIFWKTQNRATLYFYILTFIFYFIYSSIFFKKENFFKIFLIFIIPILFFNLEIKTRVQLIDTESSNFIIVKNKSVAEVKKKYEKIILQDKDNFKIILKNVKKEENFEYFPARGSGLEWLEANKIKRAERLVSNNSRWKTPNETSGRIKIWKKSINLIKKNILFGNGPQSDRNLLNKNASNIFIYVLLCGGVFSLTFLLIYLLFLLVEYLKLINQISFKKLNNDYLFIFSNLCIFFFLFRGLVENSFSLYGIDMFIFLISVKYIEIFRDFQKNY